MIHFNGTVITFNQPAWFRGQAEVVLDGALDDFMRSYEAGQSIVCDLNHGRKLGTPKLKLTEKGLDIELDTHPSPDVLKIYNKLKNREYVGGSFNYDPEKSIRQRNAQGIWEFHKLWLNTVTITDVPIYPSTQIYCRSWLTEDPYNIEGGHGDLYIDPRAASTSPHYMYTCVSCGHTQDMEWGSLLIPISAANISDEPYASHGLPGEKPAPPFKANYVDQYPPEKRLNENEARTKSIMERVNQITIY